MGIMRARKIVENQFLTTAIRRVFFVRAQVCLMKRRKFAAMIDSGMSEARKSRRRLMVDDIQEIPWLKKGSRFIEMN